MFVRKGISDERIINTKQKIASEAFGFMFLALLSIVFVKGVVLRIPTMEYITEFILFIGISAYVFFRMIFNGVYAVNLKNSKNKNKFIIAIISDGVFILAMGVLQYARNELNIVFLCCMALVFFLAFIGILSLSEKQDEKLYE